MQRDGYYDDENDELDFAIDLGPSNDSIEKVVLMGVVVKTVKKYSDEQEAPCLRFDSYSLEFYYKDKEEPASEPFDYFIDE